MPGGVSYSVGREKTTLPEGESKKASGWKWHLSQDLRKQSREKHYRDREWRPKPPAGRTYSPQGRKQTSLTQRRSPWRRGSTGNYSWDTSNQLGEKCEPLPRGLQLCVWAGLSLPQLGMQTREKRGQVRAGGTRRFIPGQKETMKSSHPPVHPPPHPPLPPTQTLFQQIQFNHHDYH